MRACAWPEYRRDDGLKADIGPHRHLAERAAELVDQIGDGTHGLMFRHDYCAGRLSGCPQNR